LLKFCCIHVTRLQAGNAAGVNLFTQGWRPRSGVQAAEVMSHN
jgi:hypothetical protein